MTRLVVVVLTLFLVISLAFGQGIPPLATTVGGEVDTINLSNLNITMRAPIRNKAGAIRFNLYETARLAGCLRGGRNCFVTTPATRPHQPN
jgi:hypothetical protein